MAAGEPAATEPAIGGRVIVVGSVNVDLVVNVARLPGPGETVSGGRFGRFAGGKGGNQAVAAARLGAPVALVAALGGDDLGREARADLAAEGIDLSAVATIKDEATGVAVIVVDGEGENLIAVASGANGALTPVAVEAALSRLGLRPGDVVLAVHEIPTAAVRAALLAGRASGATTILNPAPATGLDRSTFGLADLLTPNRAELRALVAAERRRTGRTGVSPRGRGDELEVGAGTLLQPNSEGAGVGRAVIVTLGAAGALLVRRGAMPEAFAAPAVRAVDATGAGDTFSGALAAALVAGETPEAAVATAVAAASLSTTRAGARAGMPTRADLAAYRAADL